MRRRGDTLHGVVSEILTHPVGGRRRLVPLQLQGLRGRIPPNREEQLVRARLGGLGLARQKALVTRGIPAITAKRAEWTRMGSKRGAKWPVVHDWLTNVHSEPFLHVSTSRPTAPTARNAPERVPACLNSPTRCSKPPTPPIRKPGARKQGPPRPRSPTPPVRKAGSAGVALPFPSYARPWQPSRWRPTWSTR